MSLGCKASGNAENGTSSPGAKEVGQKFGDLVMKGYWNGAYALTSPDFQRTTTVSALQSQYDNLIAQIRQDDPKFAPNFVDVYEGSLPETEEEAKEDYNLGTVPPKSEWRGALAVSIGWADNEEPRTIERGVDSNVFDINTSSGLKIASVEFDFMD
ncbi:MAG: hypothetical protein H7Y17_17630 [Chlorobia bacterium]|nr:hypothetical protein [Fimbriimonadaceae bacterium]